MWIAFALNAFFSIQWGGQYSEFEVYTTGIFEFCRQKKLLESHGPVGNTFYPSFLAYNSKVAKLILSKLPQTFTFGPMSIKKKKKVLTPKNCSLEFLPENSSLPQQSMNINYSIPSLSPAAIYFRQNQRWSLFQHRENLYN